MDLWQLKIFTKVVETKSFSKASDEINLTQPTVSSHIKELEEYFSCRLLDRLGKESIPTKAGEILYDWAMKLLNVQAQAESAMYDFLGKIKGALVIGASTIPSSYMLPILIGPFKKQYPDISIEVKTKDTAQVISDIINGDVEIGIVGGHSDHPQLSQEKLLKDEMRLIVSQAHEWASKDSVMLSDLTEVPFIAREKGSGTMRAISRAMEAANFSTDDLNIAVRFSNTASVVQGILNNVGVSILSPIAVEDHVKYGRLKALPVKGLNLTRHFYLTGHSRRAHSPVCREFIAHVRKQFQGG